MSKSTRERIGRAIRECRISRNLTQEQVAEQTGSSYTYIGSIERGERNPTLETLDRIARALQTDLFSMLLIGNQHDDTIIKILGLLNGKEPSEISRAHNLIRELFNPNP
ncbi:helix-turn-helix domain-containing protein [Cohnella soli]|uniref:Helix-turn-helix domain-containing protein n=1 Tax=Cohnella soli TaxID=425005 RepID=A0ABW0HQZ3_9BACL